LFFFIIDSSTPPIRAVAFEDFKQTRGLNLNKIFVENKEILVSKKKQFAELARSINKIKGDLDKKRVDAERKKSERLEMGKRLFSVSMTINVRRVQFSSFVNIDFILRLI
jgi:hypothetical protein